MGVIEWTLQILVAALLAAALPYVLRLERELRSLRRDRAALEGTAAGLSEATRLAEAASLRLRASAETAGRQVAEKLATAEPLRDDLHYLVDRAEAIADRLDGLVRAARAGMPAGQDVLRGSAAMPSASGSPAPAGSAAAAEAPLGTGRSRAERDLIQALLRGGPARSAAE